jgi:hypothetical protein
MTEISKLCNTPGNFIAIKICDVAQPRYSTEDLKEIFESEKIGVVMRVDYTIGSSTRDYDYSSRPFTYYMYFEYLYNNAFTQTLMDLFKDGQHYNMTFTHKTRRTNFKLEKITNRI